MNASVLHRPLAAAPSRFNAWITSPTPNPMAAVRLFCFPFAGGGASVFRTWGKTLGQAVEVCPVQLPGRESRFRDAPYTDLSALVDVLAEQVGAYDDKPFALFGHSMGSLLAFELTRGLRRRGGPRPVALFVSAHRAPHLPLRRNPLCDLPEPEFIAGVRRLGGFPEGVLESRELLDFLLPPLRADLALCDRYRHAPEAPLDCPFHLYAGRRDAEVMPYEVDAWREHTTGPAELRVFPGDHFFLRSDAEALLQAIRQGLAGQGI